MTIIIHTGTSGKKRVKRNPTKAELAEAEAARKRMDAWLALPKFARTRTPPPVRAPAPVQARQAPAKPPSLVTPGGSAAKRPSPVYTGENVLGIAQMHKSNAVPVFKDEDIKDIAKMRR